VTYRRGGGVGEIDPEHGEFSAVNGGARGGAAASTGQQRTSVRESDFNRREGITP
jgi:hypothetical protein